jgi:hypothetical protein
MTLASDLQKLKRLRELTAMEPQSVMRDEELAEIDQMMSDRQMQFLATQSAQMDAQAMSPMQQFTTSAGIEANRFVEGAKDLFGVGDPQQRQAQIGQQKLVDQAIAQRSPGINLAGNIAGGVAAAAPLAVAAEGVVPAGMGILGRTALSTMLGGAESGLMMPDKDKNETRFTNMGQGMLLGAVSEPVATGIAAGLKKAYAALKNRGVLASSSMKDQVTDALQEAGVDVESLNPETRALLSRLTSTDNVDTAIDQAIETEFGIKLTTGQRTGDFNMLREEQAALRGSDEFRAFADQQTADIFTAADEFAADQGLRRVDSDGQPIYESGLAGGEQSKVDSGQAVKGALEEARQASKAEYTELYRAADALASELGVDLPVNPQAIQGKLVEMMREHGNTHEGLLRSIESKLSNYSSARPGVAPSNPFGLDDVEARQLSLTNNEDLIRDLNALYDPNDPVAARIVAQVKDSIITAADEAMELFDRQLQFAPDITEGSRKALEAARAARASRRSYSQLWQNKDVLEALTDTKSKSTADKVAPSGVVQRVMQSPENAQAVVNLLQDRGADEALAELRTFVTKDLFDSSITGGRTTEQMISGKTLTKKFKSQEARLRVVLGDDQFTRLSTLVNQISKATNVPGAAENKSNTAYEVAGRVARLLADFSQPGSGMAVGMFDAAGAAKSKQMAATTRRALDSSPEAGLFEAVSKATQVTLPGDISIRLRLEDSNHNAFNTLMRQYLGISEENQQQRGLLSE